MCKRLTHLPTNKVNDRALILRSPTEAIVSKRARYSVVLGGDWRGQYSHYDIFLMSCDAHLAS